MIRSRHDGFRRKIRGRVHGQRIQQVHDTQDQKTVAARFRVLQVRGEELAGGDRRIHQTGPWVQYFRLNIIYIYVYVYATRNYINARWCNVYTSTFEKFPNQICIVNMNRALSLVQLRWCTNTEIGSQRFSTIPCCLPFT